MSICWLEHVLGCTEDMLLPLLLQGTVVIRSRQLVVVKHTPEGVPVSRERNEPVALYCDIIRDEFWAEHPELLA